MIGGMANTAVVFGAGQVGGFVAERLAAAGARVKVVTRSGRAGAVPGVESVRGDAMDAAFCAQVAAGASAVYHCMNPKYDLRAWTEMLPRMQDNLVAAAGRAGARLVVLDNVYALGRPGGRLMNEDTPANPCSRKGEIRARLAEALFEAHRRGDVRAVAGRGSDFFGPRGTQTMFEQRFWTRAFAGKSVQVIVDPDVPHTYHYIPDVAEGLVALGTAADDVLGRAWMLPCLPASSTRALIGQLGIALGRGVAIERVPGWLFGILKLVVPMFREIDEMLYQWGEPFVIDDSRFRARCGAAATPVDEQARATCAWARETYGAGSA